MGTDKVTELKNLIRTKYVTEAECARQLGWTRQKLNRITNGIKLPDVKEVNELSIALGTTVDEIAQFFLGKKSPNRQRKTA